MDLSEAPATYALILVNIAVSLYAFFGDRTFINQFCFHVDSVRRRDEYWRVVTSSFLHANVPHLALNVMTLFFFGPVVERTLGTAGFIVVYVGAIVASGVVSAIVNKHNPAYTSVGASDAASGVVLAFCCFYPFENIYFFGLPFGIPAVAYGALFIFMSAQLMTTEDRVIAHEGHLGGALAGLVLTIVMRPDVITNMF